MLFEGIGKFFPEVRPDRPVSPNQKLDRSDGESTVTVGRNAAKWESRFTLGRGDEGDGRNDGWKRWQWVVELAALSGLDPWPLTIRELDHGAESKVKAEWDQTAELLSMEANLHAQGKYSRNDFHPMRQSKQRNFSDPAKIFKQLKAKENASVSSNV